MSEELMAKLKHRNEVNEGEAKPVNKALGSKSIYTDFPEFTRKRVKHLQNIFFKYANENSNFIDHGNLQKMMEKLEAPQTFLELKDMIKEVDEDQDGKISLREFLLIFRKAENDELEAPGLAVLAECKEIDVDETGVRGAAQFFDTQAKKIAESGKFESEIRQEQEEKKKENELAQERKKAFKAKTQSFENCID